MRRSVLIIMLVLLVGCSSNQTQPTNVPTATNVPTSTIPQPTVTNVISTNAETAANIIANVTNVDRTAVELHEIDSTGHAKLKNKLRMSQKSM